MRIFLPAIAIILVITLAGGFWLRRDFSTKKAREKELQELEQKIQATKQRLEEISAQAPEAQARKKREREILSAQSAEDDVPVEGIEVLKKQERKIIRNRAQGYSIEMPLNLIIARSILSDWIELHDPVTMCEDPLCDPVIRIVVSSEKFPGEGESLLLGGESAYRVPENIHGIFDGYYYYWTKNDKLYSLRISSFDDSKYRDYIATIKFE